MRFVSALILIWIGVAMASPIEDATLVCRHLINDGIVPSCLATQHVLIRSSHLRRKEVALVSGHTSLTQ
jgi:hypothetical protein